MSRVLTEATRGSSCSFGDPLVLFYFRGLQEARLSSQPLQPPAKRACPVGPSEAAYWAALQAATEALDSLESLVGAGPAPSWLPAQLTALLRRTEALGRLL